jgi:hypothetical protein
MRREAPPAIGLRVGAGLLACLCVAGGCADAQRGSVGPADKVRFDLGAIGADGLEGPPDGRRAVDYEFCVPAEEAVVAEVRRIDPTAQAHPGVRGRSGCRRGQVLVMGNTHHARWRESLERLASLRYVQRIQRVDFE